MSLVKKKLLWFTKTLMKKEKVCYEENMQKLSG